MSVPQHRLKTCYSQGKYFENLFRDKVIELGREFKESSRKDNIYRHIDCYVDGYGVDVKGKRHLNTIWLELTNVRGNKGWLQGDAMYIAFHIEELDCFCLFYRKDLLQFVLNNVSEKTTNKNDYFKFYTREKWGKQDVIVKVKYDDIKHLEVKRI